MFAVSAQLERRASWQPGTNLRVGLSCCAVMGIAAFLLLFRLGEVRAPIWDEAYYLTSTARLHEGQVQFASHPPLGLMLITTGDSLSGVNRHFDWRGMASVKSIKAEQIPPDFDYRGPRLASALFGVLAAGLFFLLMLELTGSVSIGLMLSTLVLCDPALLAQFRAAHLDAFQLAFVLGGIYCAMRSLRANGSAGWTAAFAASISAAALVRANAIVLGVIALPLVWQSLLAGSRVKALQQILAGLASALTVAAGCFALMLASVDAMPDRLSEVGRIDLAHVSIDYLAEGFPAALPGYISDYAGFMAADLDGLGESDANASHPWQWLVGGGAITYRWDAGTDTVSTIGLVPNRVIWLLSLLGVIFTLTGLPKAKDPRGGALLVGWIASMASLAWLDSQRMMYAYHYFIPLMLGHAMLALIWRKWEAEQRFVLPALLAVTAFAAATLPLALHQEVSFGRCRTFLPDCGRDALQHP